MSPAVSEQLVADVQVTLATHDLHPPAERTAAALDRLLNDPDL